MQRNNYVAMHNEADYIRTKTVIATPAGAGKARLHVKEPHEMNQSAKKTAEAAAEQVEGRDLRSA